MIKVDGTTIYELNTQGTNRWYAGVQAGFDDEGNRTSQEELEKIARKLAAVDDLYEALEAAINFIDSHAADPDLTEEMVVAWEELNNLNPKDVMARARGEIE